MKNQQVVTVATWLVRKNGHPDLPLRRVLYDLFLTAYLYFFYKEKKGGEDSGPVGINTEEEYDEDSGFVSIDLNNFLYGVRKAIPIYVLTYIQKVLYPQLRAPCCPPSPSKKKGEKS